MKSLTPVHVVSKLSEAKERPEPNHKIYSALHGPPANKSAFFYEYVLTPENKVVRKEHDYKMRKKWKRVEPLYLYHGERLCVDGEDMEDVDLFSEDEDGSKQMYACHESIYNRANSEKHCRKLLRRLMGVNFKLDYPTKKLFC